MSSSFRGLTSQPLFLNDLLLINLFLLLSVYITQRQAVASSNNTLDVKSIHFEGGEEERKNTQL